MKRIASGLAAALVLVIAALGATPAEAAKRVTTPSVIGLAAATGPTSGGNMVQINGSGLTNATKVTFGGVAATTFTVVSSSQIKATAPAHAAGKVNVVVSNASGSSSDTAADDYTYYAPAPVGASVTIFGYTAPVMVCQNTPCRAVGVTTKGFASDVTCSITDSVYGAWGTPWVQGANATKYTGKMYSASYLKVTCNGVTGVTNNFLG